MTPVLHLSALPFATILVLLVSAQLPPVVEFHPPSPPEQPVPFSHRTHVAMGFECTGCHDGATAHDRATLPATTVCMTCHATIKADSADVQKLAAFDVRKEPVPWKRVYRLPDFVFFSHHVHSAAPQPIVCETCHGDVRSMTITQKVKDTSMAACMQCHVERAAPTRCDSCHEPKG